MLYIPKIVDYLKILTDEEVKDLVAINFSEYFISTKEKLYSKLNKTQYLSKVAKSLYISLKTLNEGQSNSYDNFMHLYNVEILNLLVLELQLKDTKSAIKNKLKELLSKLKKFKVPTVLVLGYKKRNHFKIFYS